MCVDCVNISYRHIKLPAISSLVNAPPMTINVDKKNFTTIRLIRALFYEKGIYFIIYYTQFLMK